ncbi:MAG: hypothetical protein RJA81_1024 [Planctomycetota bacterium]|jgi:hypothetical protein
MVNFDYLVKGLNALARAHLVNTMSGHLGAAVVSGYFIGEQHPGLDRAVISGIEGELDRIIQGESVFSPGMKSKISVSKMFEPFPKEVPTPERIDEIAKALEGNIGETRESGHNVIFAATAIRSLKDHPDLATGSVISGIQKLIQGFQGAKPGSGYYGKSKGRIDGRKVKIPHDATFQPYQTLAEMATAVLNEMLISAGQRRDGFGGLWHVINHAAALAELNLYGYEELSIKGLAAHYQHLRLFQTVPDVSEELGREAPSENDPHTKAYWTSGKIRRDRALLDHRIKTLYGFDALVSLVEDQSLRSKANESLRYLM